jgi:hypothetical protein
MTPVITPARKTPVRTTRARRTRASRSFALLAPVLMIAGILHAQDTVYYETWDIDNLETIGGHPVTYLGDPVVVSTETGNAVEFDGDGDRLLVDANPIGTSREFTVEVIFWPDACYPENADPRFLHIQDPTDPQNKRVMIELRLTPDNRCYLDGFMNTDNDNLTLVDESLTHPTETWLHAAITYKEGVFKTYVNGVEELSGNVGYQELILGETGKTSLGSRMDERNWFRGKIKTVKVTRKALSPAEFLYHGSTAGGSGRFSGYQEDSFSVYPVPADHELIIEPRPGIHSDFKFGITDLLGRVWNSREICDPSSPPLKVNISRLENGIYLLRLRTDAASQTSTILVHHPD